MVEDNGSGIAREQIGPVFGKLLYGSKFQSIGGKQGRGDCQGDGEGKKWLRDGCSKS